MSKDLKKSTSIFSIKKASIKGNETIFTDKILNNNLWKEYIIIIGSQKYQHAGSIVKFVRNYYRDDAGINGKFMFVHQALRRVRRNKEYDFNWTILIYEKGYTSNQMNATEKAFRNFAPQCNFVKISNYQEAINYIHSKDKKQSFDSKNLRQKNPIERIFIYCHGFVGRLAMGLSNRHKRDENLDWDEKVVAKLQQTAFSDTARIYSFSCKTGLGNERIEELDSTEEIRDYQGYRLPTVKPPYEIKTLPLLGEKSLAQKIAEATGAIVYAYCSRSDYEDTLNTPDELDFINYYRAGDGDELERKNDRYRYLIDRKNRTSEDIKRYKELIRIHNSRPVIDGGRFDPQGARYPVKGGTTPKGVPNDMKTYIKRKNDEK